VLFRVNTNRFEKLAEVNRMYTGRMIDELIQSVERVEVDAQHRREDELFQQLLHAYMVDFPQQEMTGVV
jgi:hypothetical protein